VVARSGAFEILAFASSAPGSVGVRACGSPAAGTDPSALFDTGTTAALSVVRSDNAWVYASTLVHFKIVRIANVSVLAEPTRSQFVPLASPVDVFSGFVTGTRSVGRPTQIPADATGAVVSIEAGGSAFGAATVGSCAVPPPQSLAAFAGAWLDAAVVLPRLGAADALCVTTVGGATRVDVVLLGWMATEGPDVNSLPPMWSISEGPSPEPGLVPINPDRALDTRNGIGAPVGQIPAGTTFRLDTSDYVTPWTTALSLNVTITGPDRAGFLTVWPCDQPRPDASNLNFVAGQTRANLVVAKLAGDGTVCLWADATHMIADVTGLYDFAFGTPAQGITPARLLDTRNAIGIPTTTIVPTNGVVTLQVAGRQGIPVDAVAATLNITGVEAGAAGFLTVWPCDQPMPDASNLNYVQGSTVPNLVTVALSATGAACIFTSAPIHLLADAGGWFGDSATSGLVELDPSRSLDTRNGIGAPRGKLARNGVLTLQVAGRNGVRSDASIAVLNVTVTGPESDGFATIWPCDAPRPDASNLNFRSGDTVANLVSVRLSANGTVCISADARTDVLADVAGFLTSTPTVVSTVRLA
jgi:hypothetical protein